MNIKQQTALKENKMTITASKLIRWSGLSAMVAGIIYAGIQPIHPPDFLSSVTTTAWAIITPLKTMMSFLFLIGITGLYARQVNKVGWLGLVGYLMLSLCWALELAFIFAEAFIIPQLVAAAPTFIEGFFGIVNGHPVDVPLGSLPGLYAFMGVLYLLGGLLFGIATFRAGILSRWAAGLLATASILTPIAALLPHETQRLAGIPVGLALAWLGFSLWSERREGSMESVLETGSTQLSQAGAK
jgi:hypothetical protein